MTPNGRCWTGYRTGGSWQPGWLASHGRTPLRNPMIPKARAQLSVLGQSPSVIWWNTLVAEFIAFLTTWGSPLDQPAM